MAIMYIRLLYATQCQYRGHNLIVHSTPSNSVTKLWGSVLNDVGQIVNVHVPYTIEQTDTGLLNLQCNTSSRIAHSLRQPMLMVMEDDALPRFKPLWLHNACDFVLYGISFQKNTALCRMLQCLTAVPPASAANNSLVIWLLLVICWHLGVSPGLQFMLCVTILQIKLIGEKPTPWPSYPLRAWSPQSTHLSG